MLLDGGTELPFDGEAFAAGGLRPLRLRQQVNLAMDGDRISVVTLSTFDPVPD